MNVGRFLLLFSLLLSACTPPTAEPSAPPPGAAPASAEVALGDLTAQLLLYHHRHQQFPASLVELTKPPISASPALLLDPSSGKPFVYLPNGPAVPGRPGRLMLYQPQSAGSFRWVLLVVESDPDRVITFVEPMAETVLRHLVP